MKKTAGTRKAVNHRTNKPQRKSLKIFLLIPVHHFCSESVFAILSMEQMAYYPTILLPVKTNHSDENMVHA